MAFLWNMPYFFPPNQDLNTVTPTFTFSTKGSERCILNYIQKSLFAFDYEKRVPKG